MLFFYSFCFFASNLHVRCLQVVERQAPGGVGVSCASAPSGYRESRQELRARRPLATRSYFERSLEQATRSRKRYVKSLGSRRGETSLRLTECVCPSIFFLKVGDTGVCWGLSRRSWGEVGVITGGDHGATSRPGVSFGVPISPHVLACVSLDCRRKPGSPGRTRTDAGRTCRLLKSSPTSLTPLTEDDPDD